MISYGARRREMNSKYRLGHGKIVSAICKNCGRYYYCDENYRKGTCDICNSLRMKGKKRSRGQESRR